jgi:hypothetical protein
VSNEFILKDPNSIEPFFVIWCSRDGTNNGGASDTGELQGATIVTSDWTVPTGITEDDSDTSSITIRGVVYAVNTTVTIWLSGGTAGTNYALVNRITTSDARTLDQTMTILVREK